MKTKLVSLRLDKSLLDQLPTNKSQFIRDAIFEKLYPNTQVENILDDVEKVVQKHRLLSRGVSDRKTKQGLLYSTYHGQCGSCKRRGHNPPKYSKDGFINHFIEDETFKKLFKYYKDNGFKHDDVPSFDRLDDNKTYSFDNIQCISWGKHQKLTAKRNKVKPSGGIPVSCDGVDYPSLTAMQIHKGWSVGSDPMCISQGLKENGGVFTYKGFKIKKLKGCQNDS